MKRFLAVILVFCLFMSACSVDKSVKGITLQLSLVSDTLFGNEIITTNADSLCLYAYPKSYFDYQKKVGEDMGEFYIVKVTCDDKPVSYQFIGNNNDILKIELSNDKNENKDVVISFGIKLKNGNSRLSMVDGGYNLGNFICQPCVYKNGDIVECSYTDIGDPFISECYNYNVSLVVSTEYVVASSGKPTSSDLNDDRVMYKYQFFGRDFSFNINKNFNVKVINVDDVDVYYYYLDDEKCR